MLPPLRPRAHTRWRSGGQGAPAPAAAAGRRTRAAAGPAAAPSVTKHSDPELEGMTCKLQLDMAV